jgi:prevent-host-death family protein
MAISITEFKTHCLQILRDVEQTRKPVEISKQGKVRFRVIPVLEPQKAPWERLRGSGTLHATAEESVLSDEDFSANQ